MAPKYRGTLTKKNGKNWRLFQEREKGQQGLYCMLEHDYYLMLENMVKNGL